MKEIRVYNYQYDNFKLKVGLIEEKIAYIGFENEDLLNWFKTDEFDIVETNEILDNKHSNLLNSFFNKEILDLDFDDLYVVGTEFQKEVWKELMTILPGSTIFCKQLAGKLKRLDSIRAVTRAVQKNPILLLIPCHRVIPYENEEYAYRAGEECKQMLLELES
ncbi:methylated-DNA--[protein]-cysteine S-methyltransferase [Spiroplasma apis]|uniref:Methylated-DNA-[protein]-cysteine S-methyltransferase DNA binding domain-containing protein n=1 Tax=Spiroplasma apis B31 TaxID=1276258 RepID=V5RI41_SPIAP|nr:methylated-DNA--[protein]-cysteine S-methyltransferase [Spiroplasma apis]AHB36123.1 hypothetical protein SAPIS_v1c02770 [Spiroplasma apis B31]